MHVHTVYLHVCMHACMHVRMYAYINVCMYVCVYVCMRIRIYVSLSSSVSTGGGRFRRRPIHLPTPGRIPLLQTARLLNNSRRLPTGSPVSSAVGVPGMALFCEEDPGARALELLQLFRPARRVVLKRFGIHLGQVGRFWGSRVLATGTDWQANARVVVSNIIITPDFD